MVPFAAQSHLNQLLQMADVISSYDMPVHFASSTFLNSQVKSRASNSLQHLTKIKFHDLAIPPNRNPDAKTDVCKDIINFEITMGLRQQVAGLLRSLSLSARRLVVDFVSLPNAEAYAFNCVSAFSISAFQRKDLGENNNDMIKELYAAKSCSSSSARAITIVMGIMSYSKAGMLHNSCRAIEGSFLELLANDNSSGEKMWAVGPLHPMTTNFKGLRDHHKCLLEWLDEQEPNSVLYISFGTTISLSDEQVKKIALGLEKSGVKFIWVLRDRDKSHHFSTEEGRKIDLPNGFEERVKGIGKVTRKWVPQLDILGHPSTGGFLSHCGWNSCMESISMGVPIAAWPMQWDQPYNALLITKVLKVGVPVMEWSQSDEVVTSSRISKVVRRLMASEEGHEIRKRVVEMAKSCSSSSARAIAIVMGIMSHSKAGMLHNSCRGIEGSFLEHLANDNSSGEKMWAVGLLHPMTTNFKELRDHHKCLLKWLDEQEPNSVLYISFGTTTSLSDEQVKKIALGLEQSGVKFIWVWRDRDKSHHFSTEEDRRIDLPNGFEERVKGIGKVMRKWVPQLDILGHPSTGGFLSHCGWNSCMQSISMGVPIVAWPMQCDQPYNAVLITKVLKVGVPIMEWSQSDKVVTSSRISKAVRRLMAS
ncbi:UDP-glucuronosyl/UDP-glucosyltransferase [Trema orientale]|uniref:UDP-glucuronosyl/UDP-glucosyltransferase n=1 Tax=Trema orientale TaxID=63057 RepID=A0A2P5EXT3_TREOI|nr:UDP-glucuronosyl/UDP-glucosyltransferase [Trema orientale]